MNALGTRRQTARPVAKVKSSPSLRVAREDDSAAHSQTAVLQNYIEAEFTEQKPPRRMRLGISLPLVAALSGALWIAIVVGARAVFG